MVKNNRRWYGVTVHANNSLDAYDVVSRHSIETTNTHGNTVDISKIYFEANLTEEEAVILKLSVEGIQIYLRDIEFLDTH